MAMLAASVLLAAGCRSVGDRSDLESLGLRYQFREIGEPRPNRAHILQVDLSSGKLEPRVVIGEDPDGDGPAETALTDPRKLAAGDWVLGFINTNPWDSFPGPDGKKNRNWFEGQPVDIYGLAIASGRVRSSHHQHAPAVWIDPDGRLQMGSVSRDPAGSEGMNGFSMIVTGGQLAVGEGGDIHPRTSIGVSREGDMIWLVVVDGRQRGYSEGMNLHELGALMLELGCWNAANMDGGGSSIMGMVGASGELQVMNSPSDRHLGAVKIRPLPMVLTIRKSEEKKE